MPTSVWYHGVANSEALEPATHGQDPLFFISCKTFCLLPLSEPWCLHVESRGMNGSFVQDGKKGGRPTSGTLAHAAVDPGHGFFAHIFLDVLLTKLRLTQVANV